MIAPRLKIFVSSVQKELENERIAVTELIASDPFLERNVEPVLFEQLPASSKSAEKAYLDALRACRIYIGILGFEYGRKGADGLSATHREYKEAKKMGLPAYFFVKGDNSHDERRGKDLQKFFKEVSDEKHGHVYKRFTHYQSLKSRVRDILLKELEKKGLRPTREENQIAEQTIDQSSDFDTSIVLRASDSDLDDKLCRQFSLSVTGKSGDLDSERITQLLLNRGMLWQDKDSGDFHPTAAGLLLFGSKPESFYPQVRIAANAYGGVERGEPIDRDDIRTALPEAVERVFQFLRRNMRHTTRIE